MLSSTITTVATTGLGLVKRIILTTLFGIFINYTFLILYTYPMFSHAAIAWYYLSLIVLIFLLLPLAYFFIGKMFAIQSAVANILKSQKPLLAETLAKLLKEAISRSEGKTPEMIIAKLRSTISNTPFGVRVVLNFLLNRIPLYEHVSTLIANGEIDNINLEHSSRMIADEAEVMINDNLLSQGRIYLMWLVVLNILGIVAIMYWL